MEMANSSTHEASFCNLSIGSTPQRALLSMVKSAPIGTGQDDQQLKFACGVLNNKQFSVWTFSRGKCRKIPRPIYTTHGAC